MREDHGPLEKPCRTTPPYPHVQRSRDLMSRLGVTPTIQTSKEFEGIFRDDKDDAPLPQGLKLNLDDDTSDYGDDPEMLCGPIIELAPAPVAGPSRTTRCATGSYHLHHVFSTVAMRHLDQLP